jgi:hypothetical protein
MQCRPVGRFPRCRFPARCPSTINLFLAGSVCPLFRARERTVAVEAAQGVHGGVAALDQRYILVTLILGLLRLAVAAMLTSFTTTMPIPGAVRALGRSPGLKQVSGYLYREKRSALAKFKFLRHRFLQR